MKINLDIVRHNQIRKTQPRQNFLYGNRSNLSFMGSDSVSFSDKNSLRICIGLLLDEPDEVLQALSHDFNPNYLQHKSDPMSVLAARKTQSIFGFSPKNKKYNEIFDKIVYSSEFDPNIRWGNKNENTLIEYAINNKNKKLFIALIATGKLKDPYNDSWKTLKALGKKKRMREIFLLDSCKSYVEDKKTSEAKTLNNNVHQKPVKRFETQNKILKKYEVQLLKSDPQSLDDVGGMKEAKEEIIKFIINPWSEKFRSKLIKNNIQTPNGFLMSGPPGCGKTYIVKAIASQANLPLYEIDLAAVGSSNAYETEKNLRSVFNGLSEQYEKTGRPSILFLDEIDAICASRKNIKTDWKIDEMNTVLKLLNNASEKGIIVIGATNRPDGLDPAALRSGRFDKKIEVPLPDRESRMDILSKLISKKPIAKELKQHISEIADLTDGRTCSDIVSMINESCREAIYGNKSKVLFEDVKNVFEETIKSSIGNPKRIGLKL